MGRTPCCRAFQRPWTLTRPYRQPRIVQERFGNITWAEDLFLPRSPFSGPSSEILWDAQVAEGWQRKSSLQMLLSSAESTSAEPFPCTYLGLSLRWSGLPAFRRGCAPYRLRQQGPSPPAAQGGIGFQDGGWAHLRVKRALRRGLVFVVPSKRCRAVRCQHG